MNISGLKRIFFIILITFTFITWVACYSGNKNDHIQPATTEENKVINDQNRPDEVTTVLEASPVNTTIFNKDQDVWGWHTDDYIILKWNPEKYSYFMVYRKTESDNDWKPAADKKISRNEFFDNKIKAHRILRYRIVAVDKNNKSVHTYDQLMFEFGD